MAETFNDTSVAVFIAQRDIEETEFTEPKQAVEDAGSVDVVVDQGLVTGRTPGDLSAFCDKVVEEFDEGRH